MKRRMSALFMAVLLIFTASSCTKSEKTLTEYGMNVLGEWWRTPNLEQIFPMDGSGAIRLDFDIPADGRLKLKAYDSTEYEEWPEELPVGTVSFYDAQGQLLYENLPLEGGYIEKCRVEEGKLQAELTFTGEVEGMKEITVSWAFAEEGAEATLSSGKATSAIVSDQGEATFALSIEEDGLYEIAPAEGARDEWDCKFSIIDQNGAPIAKDLMIHSNEWIKRKVYLPKGEYKVLVEEVAAVATCKVDLVQKLLENKEGLPAQWGAIQGEEETISFSIHQEKQLEISAEGIGTYYDWEQAFTYTLLDQKGGVVKSEECEGSAILDITGYQGAHQLKIAPDGNCFISVKMS